ncbi:MAG TPA: radical SAM protein [Verrucomicrobiae bacterium]|nr:radical SAM protein [Verrucomicrobiae bacterium]
MRDLIARVGWRVYYFVHTNGWVADVVYRSAFHVLKWRRRWTYWRVSRRGVSPEQLYPHRHLVKSSLLITGVTNICNAKCSFCAYPRVVENKTLQTGVMPFETFKKAADEWGALGGEDLDLTPVVGDPLVDPGILEKLDYAVHQAHIKRVYLTTNGILLDRNDTYKKLIDLGVAGVFISTQGANKAAYEKTYGVKKYDEAMSGIRHLLEYNRSKGEPAGIVIRFRNSETPGEIIRSRDFVDYIKPFLSPRVRVNFTVDFDNWGGTIQASDLNGFMKLRELPPQINVPCGGLFGFSVRHDGSVRLCGCRLVSSDLDDLVVGNIHEKSLTEISRSDKAWEIIKGFYSGKRPETCVGCTLYNPIHRDWLKKRQSEN